MATLTKKRKELIKKIDSARSYSLDEAAKLVKVITNVKFDATVNIAVRLGIDVKKPEQLVRGTVMLPHGTGKNKTVLVLCTPDKEADAKKGGADFVGMDDFIAKIKAGWTDFDVLVTMPTVMPKVGALGKILGPKGLMPNPKAGTVTMDIARAVQDVKKGKIELKVDKYGIIHSVVGKVSFDNNKLTENARELLQTIIRLKPASAKGSYIKSVFLSSTMSPGIKIDITSFEN